MTASFQRCGNCGTEQESSSNFCSRCGSRLNDPYQEQAAITRPRYFAVSTLKLIVMSVCTFGLYEVYWFYKNWSFINDNEEPNIRPFARAFFGFFYCYSCFQRIRATAQSLDLKDSIAAGPLATGWIIVTLMWRLPDPLWLATFFAVLFLVPVQILVNKINASVSPGYEENKRFTAWNIVGVVIGGIFFIANLI